MYSFKKYAHNGDFISEIPQKFIKNIPTFHETMNSGQGELSLEFSENISENFLKFGELVKIFYNENLIYSGFVSRREKIFSEKNSIVFYLVGIFDSLRHYKREWLKSYILDKNDKNFSRGKALVFFREMIEILKSESNIYLFDENKINDTSSEYNEKVNGSFIDLLNYFKKENDMNYFLGADGFLRVGNGKNHILFFNKDIFEIKIETDFGEVTNFIEFTAKFSLRDSQRYTDSEDIFTAQDLESIKKIGKKYKNFGEKKYGVVYIEDYQNFRQKTQEYTNKILEKVKNPFLNIKLKIFDKKYFGVLKILDTLTIQNFSEEIENKKIVKISYNHDYIEVELENYNTLGKEILGQ